MRTRALALGSALAISLAAACSSSKSTGGDGGVDDLTDDTHHEDAGPGTPLPPADAGPVDAATTTYDNYAPALDTCRSCSCPSSSAFCFAGGIHAITPPDAAPAACVIVDAGAVEPGCNTLPPACAAKPTCECVIAAIQPSFTCYLVCTPDPGYLLVYCPNP